MSNMNLENVKTVVRQFVEKYPTLDEYATLAASKTNIDKAYIAIVASLVPMMLVVSIGFGRLIIDLVGFIYPVYASIKAIETDGKDDDIQWLTYWLIFGMFKVLESITDILISFIPFYFVLKVIFLIWCYYPTTLGASVIYRVVISPYLVPLIMDDHSTPSSPKKDAGFKVRVLVKEVRLPSSSENVYCEIGFNGVAFRTHRMNGQNLHFNAPLDFNHVRSLESGRMVVEVNSQSTFGDESGSFGTAVIEKLSESSENQVFELTTDKDCVITLHVQVTK